MSLTDLFVQLGLYEAEIARTPEYDALVISKPAGESLEDALRQLNTAPAYDPRRIKATTLRTLALRYIHFVLNHTLIGRGNNAEVVNDSDFDFLLSMIRSPSPSLLRGPILALVLFSLASISLV